MSCGLSLTAAMRRGQELQNNFPFNSSEKSSGSVEADLQNHLTCIYRTFRFGIREMVKKCKLWEMKYHVAHIQNHSVRKHAYPCASVSEVHCKVPG